MSVFRLARFELRRMTRGRLPRAALAVLTVIPLLYGALYLYAFWDPYGNLNRIPVAMVVADRPAEAGDGTVVHAGQDLADELLDRKVFGWTVTDERDAQSGLRDGRYHLVFEIPADFSASLAAGPEPDQAAHRGELKVVNDDATNYLSGLLARSAFAEIRAAAGESASASYFEKMLIGFTDLKAETGKAADGAGQIHDGLGDAGSGAGKIAGGIDRSEQGAGQLADGLGSAAKGADELADGIGQLRTGAAKIADGTARAAAETSAAARKVDSAANRIEPVLRDNAEEIQRSATAVATGAQALADNIDALPQTARQAATDAQQVRDRLTALVAAHPELAGDPDVVAARKAADEAATAAQKVVAGLDGADLAGLKARMNQVAATAREIAAAAPHLADDVASARAKVDQLAAGLDTLADGSAQLRDGLGDAATGAEQLRGGLFRLATGARELDSGLNRLTGAQQQLVGGLSKLEGGAGDLADGLAAGEKKIPGYDDAGARSDVLGDPVALDRQARHPAASYGVGFAPYFLGLALWVGAMITYMLLRPVNRRHVMSGAAGWRVALAGWLPAAAIGLAQAGVLFGVVTQVLGLDPVHPAATLGLLALVSLAFTAIMQWLGAQLGPAGRLAALALLMLQLTSSGGTYPVQTSPGFFQAVHPWLPMTYVVAGLRHTINGGPTGPVLTGALVLAAFGLGALALTVGATRRSRRLTPSKLHPELTM
ncbi:YhgE/Pip domain-containing protein [Micromonospora mirobrigensis]|uniref:Putative membrane protein n=1 Tax=Micromonospora mirobrigensis TaxID=262898 RepID=A0A1C4TYI6_9ACTN|nr:YhgE/Pip domain-containing protein [Micromonospora mirobrigensis]SCE64459.1 putative membrane protein [Micromonospora mirobrigensis]